MARNFKDDVADIVPEAEAGATHLPILLDYFFS